MGDCMEGLVAMGDILIDGLKGRLNGYFVICE